MDIEKNHIVVVEDEKSLRDLCITSLENSGWKVTAAPCGDVGLQTIADLYHAGQPPDIILTDIIMPGSLDGVQMIRRLKEDGAVNDTQLAYRVIFMSGDIGKHTPEELAQLSWHELLDKPFSFQKLKAVLALALKCIGKPSTD